MTVDEPPVMDFYNISVLLNPRSKGLERHQGAVRPEINISQITVLK